MTTVGKGFCKPQSGTTWHWRGITLRGRRGKSSGKAVENERPWADGGMDINFLLFKRSGAGRLLTGGKSVILQR
jgi:hypothetical protein